MKNFKKVLALLLCVIMVVSFVACSKGSDKKETTAAKKEETTETTTETTTEEALSGTIELEGCTIETPDGWSAKKSGTGVTFTKDGESMSDVEVSCSTNTQSAKEWGEDIKGNFQGKATVDTVKVGDTEWVRIVPTGVEQVYLYADQVATEKAIVKIDSPFLTFEQAKPIIEAVTVK